MAKVPIKTRIQNAFKEGDYELSYHQLLGRVFPADDYPKAWRYSCNGGPPGCAMAFRKALNGMGMRGHYRDGKEYFLPPRVPTPNESKEVRDDGCA